MQASWAAWHRFPWMLGVLLCSLLETNAANLAPRWRWSNPLPHGGNVYGMAYGLDLTVQVAERGQLYSSENLIDWMPYDTGTTNTLLAAVFFNDRLIAVGERGTVVWTDSLEDFFVIDLGTPNWLMGAAASSSLVILVGDNGAIYSSITGTNWSQENSSVTNWLCGAAYGKNTFVAVGQSGVILTSNNGKTWKKSTSGTTRRLNGVFAVNGSLYAVGDQGVVLRSDNDGSSWSTISGIGATNSLYAAAGITNFTVLAGEKELRLQETNGPWTDELATNKVYHAPAWTYYSALGQVSELLTAGRSGMILEGFKTNATGSVWVNRYNSVRNWIWEITRTADLYVAVGDQATIMTSADGVNWDLELPPNTATNAVLLGVGGNSNLLVAVGNRGTLLYSPASWTNVITANYHGSTTVLSTNLVNTMGIQWSHLTNAPTTNDLHAVAASTSGYLVAGGNGCIFFSATGTQWTPATNGSKAFLSGATWFPGGFVVVGDRGTISTSVTGTNWNNVTTGTTNWIYRVRYLNGQLVAVGQNGTILTSPNASTWTLRTTGITNWLNDVAFAGDTYYAVGNQGTVLASSNAINWVSIGTLTYKSLFGAATFGQQLVVAGIEGAILRSPILPDTTPVSLPQFAFSSSTNGLTQKLFLITGHTDQQFNLESSTNLMQWVPGPTLEIYESDGTLLYLETSTNQASEFFRARAIP